MKTIATFNNPTGAHLLIARLGGSGIRAFVRDEHIVSLESAATSALGGVKVDVAEQDYERAIEIMGPPPTDGAAGQFLP